MFRSLLTLCGFGLLLLWITGLATPSSHLVSWLDLVAAFCSFIGAGNTTPHTYKSTVAKGILSLCAGLLAISLYSFNNTHIPWQTLWNFGFGCFYLLLGIAAANSKTRLSAVSTHDDEMSNRVA